MAAHPRAFHEPQNRKWEEKSLTIPQNAKKTRQGN